MTAFVIPSRTGPSTAGLRCLTPMPSRPAVDTLSTSASAGNPPGTRTPGAGQTYAPWWQAKPGSFAPYISA